MTAGWWRGGDRDDGEAVFCPLSSNIHFAWTAVTSASAVVATAVAAAPELCLPGQLGNEPLSYAAARVVGPIPAAPAAPAAHGGGPPVDGGCVDQLAAAA